MHLRSGIQTEDPPSYMICWILFDIVICIVHIIYHHNSKKVINHIIIMICFYFILVIND